MPIITALYLYPIKSCAGIALNEAELSETGLRVNGVGDREWMIVDHNGLFLSQRECPLMATIKPVILNHQLLLQAPNTSVLPISIRRQQDSVAQSAMRQVQVWDDILMAEDCGEEASAWCSKVLGTPCHLVRFLPSVQRLRESQWSPGVSLSNFFSDGFPMLLTSEASLSDLNQQLTSHGRPNVPMDRFRPNIVIDGESAFEEEYVDTYIKPLSEQQKLLKQEEIVLKPVKPCPRCPIPGVNQDTGVIEPNPVDILQTYHTHPRLDNAPVFGMNTIVQTGKNQWIRVGDFFQSQIAF